MTKLEEVVSLCKCGVHVSFNEHRDMYASVRDECETIGADDIAPEVLAEMERTDTMVTVQCYPRTPIGSYTVAHHSLDEALDEMLEILRSES